MREILFRGKTIDSGEFVYGYYIYAHTDNSAVICSVENGFVDVDPATVGQYTGLTDKNGVKIFEGDIISTDLSRPYTVIEFKNGAFMHQCEDNGYAFHDIFFACSEPPKIIYPYGEVIGSIHDNPDLLEETG